MPDKRQTRQTKKPPEKDVTAERADQPSEQPTHPIGEPYDLDKTNFTFTVADEEAQEATPRGKRKRASAKPWQTVYVNHMSSSVEWPFTVRRWSYTTFCSRE